MFQLDNKTLGTPQQCLKKGIGVGLNLPIPSDYPRRYKPIIPSNSFCGKKENKPLGKKMGSVGDCFRKGVGVGKKLQMERDQTDLIEFFNDDVAGATIVKQKNPGIVEAFLKRYWPLLLTIFLVLLLWMFKTETLTIVITGIVMFSVTTLISIHTCQDT